MVLVLLSVAIFGFFSVLKHPVYGNKTTKEDFEVWGRLQQSTKQGRTRATLKHGNRDPEFGLPRNPKLQAEPFHTVHLCFVRVIKDKAKGEALLAGCRNSQIKENKFFKYTKIVFHSHFACKKWPSKKDLKKTFPAC